MKCASVRLSDDVKKWDRRDLGGSGGVVKHAGIDRPRRCVTIASHIAQTPPLFVRPITPGPPAQDIG